LCELSCFASLLFENYKLFWSATIEMPPTVGSATYSAT
jgi:hypothetical protein